MGSLHLARVVVVREQLGDLVGVRGRRRGIPAVGRQQPVPVVAAGRL